MRSLLYGIVFFTATFTAATARADTPPPIKDPVNAQELGRWPTHKPKGRGTHRNVYQGGRYVHFAAYVRMEDVPVDTRDYIYVTGGAQKGLHVLRDTDPRK